MLTLLTALLPYAFLPTAYGACINASSNPKAVYTMTNDVPNSILAFAVSTNLSLEIPVSVATGGNGGQSIAKGVPNYPDTLASGHSVEVFDRYLFNVNAGSNSVSMFEIAITDPTQLRLLGAFPAPGDFPVSLAVAHSIVCVGFAGARTGVSCAPWDSTGIGSFDLIRPTASNDTRQVTPPDVSFDIACLTDILFTGDGSALVAVATGSNISTDSTLTVWPLDYTTGQLALEESGRASLPGIRVGFSGASLPGTSQLFLTDGLTGAFVVDTASLYHGDDDDDDDDDDVLLSHTVVPGQIASCWAQVHEETGLGFIADSNLNRFVQVDVSTGEIRRTFNSTNGNDGYLDVKIVGDTLFALGVREQPRAKFISVFDLAGDVGDVENVPIPGGDVLGMGLAVFV
ncbi:hypothetical protein ASPZODRAFT_137401 [Penicilliopsis zonata CBS 506.65]|uniref:SMP-30/Gluconolactonase/LRE-like region domain-containing protein n=1 Tax=Penicilliopsis zonata CBS 506.65 TaxID=1073090 RepID=A0A1L9S530_9EURO|nr:hypothetical protein ASPZODRAFT_137401 [Penicilliopsis zonata CBS 506.65]OJJ42261.1 hypothetical protein ASPZODRAFT_137401 [Penicilliopsis zonata CBS 506.65]